MGWATDTLPLHDRFERADKSPPVLTAGVYLARIGLEQSDPRLASLRTRSGYSSLHAVAMGIRLWDLDLKAQRCWKELGLTILQHGGDPSSVGTWTVDWQQRSRTPLLDLLDLYGVQR